MSSHGEVLASYNCQFWLNHVTWDPSGLGLCYCSHDGTLNFCDLSEGKKGPVTKLTHVGLPFTTAMYIDSNTLIAAGYDKTPYLFTKSGDTWSLAKVFDDVHGCVTAHTTAHSTFVI